MGFTALEAEVYLQLLSASPATGYRIAQALGKPTANVYKAIESLNQKGAVLVEDGTSRLCRAVPSEELLAQSERGFAARRARAARAIAEVRSAADDHRVYPLRTHGQVLERVRRMLASTERIALLDLFPAPFADLRADIEATVARGVDVFLELYEPTEIPGADVTLSWLPDEALRRWPGDAVQVVTDAREWLIALLAPGEERVLQAVWTASSFLAATQHTCLASELQIMKVRNLLAAGAQAAEIGAALAAAERLRLRHAPGFPEFLALSRGGAEPSTDPRSGVTSMSTRQTSTRRALGAVALAGALAGASPVRSSSVEPPPLIPRSTLFGSPDKAAPQLSPDGRRLAFLAPEEGVLNVWIGTPEDPSGARPITHDRGSGVLQYFWAYDGAHLLYLKDRAGDENHHLHKIELATGAITDLTPIDGVRAQVVGLSPRHPGSILVGLNDRDPRLHDIYRIEIATGARTLVEANPGYLAYLADEEYRVRFAVAPRPDGGQVVLRRGSDGEFAEWTSIPAEDSFNTGPAALDADGTTLYMYDSRGRNTSVVTAVDLASGAETLLAEDPRADAENLIVHPTTGRIRAVSFNYDRRTWRVLDPAIRSDLDHLRTLADGEVQILSTTLDDSHWIVGYMMDDGPYRYYHYDRGTRRASLLFTNRKALEGVTLARMHTRTLRTRDGLEMVAYLSLPPESDPDGDGVPERPLPMVLQVHGGPWHRDNWGLNPYHQWATNRGYAILAVQFRGSTGFGKSFINAADGEWGGKMHDDLLDAVEWAVRERIAQRDRIAIMGGSYGGYAVLWGLTATPRTFACGVDIFGVSSLVTMLESFPAYWGPAMEIFYRRVGDPRTEEGRKFLLSRSPLSYVEKIERPLLIVHGANDVRVKLAESEQLVSKMKERRIPVTYIVYPDEGHLTFFHPQNNVSCYAVAEAFLAQHLGGRAEPIGDALRGASARVREGAGHVPGLEAALEDQS